MLVQFVFAKVPEFIIPQKNSKNELKEIIGSNFKLVIDKCAEVVQNIGVVLSTISKDNLKETGNILQIVGDMQKTFSNKAQELVENKSYFKKASREQLDQAVKGTENIVYKLSQQIELFGNKINMVEIKKNFNEIKSDVNSIHCLKI